MLFKLSGHISCIALQLPKIIIWRARYQTILNKIFMIYKQKVPGLNNFMFHIHLNLSHAKLQQHTCICSTLSALIAFNE